MRVAVTGAAGFLGGALCRHLAVRGFEVVALARDPSHPPAGLEALDWRRCELPEDVASEAFAGCEALVHCAYDTRFTRADRARAVNVTGSERVFAAARRAGAGRIVFVSSMSAHEEALSVYGRTKLEVEALLDPARDLAVRPGHILGPGGVFWRTARSIAALPVIPLFYGGRQRLQTIHVDDACEGFARALERGLTGRLLLSEAEPVALRDFYGAIATCLGRPARFLPLPGDLVRAGLRLAETVGFSLPLSSDNLLGLKRLKAFDVADDLRRLELTPRTMRESLAEMPWQQIARR